MGNDGGEKIRAENEQNKQAIYVHDKETVAINNVKLANAQGKVNAFDLRAGRYSSVFRPSA